MIKFIYSGCDENCSVLDVDGYLKRKDACWHFYFFNVMASGGCRYPSIKPGLKGNRSCYTSAYT